ncbi:MAG: hypothetical protein ACTSRG_07825 [Candidatus Helarchaeota archaeon]
MTNYGFVGTLIIHSQTLVWFAMIGFLIILALKTKLTHVDEFRKNFTTGIFILLATSSIFIITNYYLIFTQDFLDILNIFLLTGIILSSAMIIFGLFKLNAYLSSIIDFDELKYKKIAIVFAISASIIIYILNLTVRSGTFVDYISRTVEFFTSIIFFFIFIYNMMLHREMKDIEIDMIGFFGTGFMFLTFTEILGIFFDWMDQGLYYILFNFCYIFMLLFLILGYLNFKNHMKNIKK